ncbi:sugar ABC transporter ATP-binding protein [Avibacterium endocarditidis]|uniref:sugar ABC transporter ATP-binding protein n=1 Tax=Avibacterium TaxID=292486 RepID=UPI0039FD2CAF
MIAEQNLLEVKGLKKAFGDVIALKDARFTLKKGSIHALCGGNGAGKSTFLSLLMGFIQPDEGEILIKGKAFHFSHPKQAIDAGIAIVQQELSVIPDLSVAENIYLGSEPRKMGFIDFKTLHKKTRTLLDSLGFTDISESEKMRNLSVAEQQLVEIAKALSHANAEIIILDEPTSAISEEDTQKLFSAIRHLTRQGKGIIYVSHRLSEILTIADSYTIFRDGCYITQGKIAEITREMLIKHIIGSELNEEFAKYNQPEESLLFEAKNICWKDKLHNISFQLHKGEILGIYGLVDSGRSELFDLIFGIHYPDEGEFYLHQHLLSNHSPKQAIEAGIAYVTEDRRDTGLILCRSINENINITHWSALTKYAFIKEGLGNASAEEMIKKFNIKTPNAQQKVINLSGGNQQKVILGKWALTNPDLMLLDEPTRGIDIGAKKEIYHFMSQFAQQGKGILLVSSELSEIIGMSDRILVFKEGKINGILTRNEFSQTKLMQLAS